MTRRIAIARRRTLQGQGSDAGLTLAELLVTISLLGMVLTMLVGLVVNVSRTFTENRAGNDSTNQASIAMNEVTRVIRSGTEIRAAGQPLNRPVFTSVANEAVILHAYIDTAAAAPQPVQVRFYITTLPDGTRGLREARYRANAGTGPYWTFQSSSYSDRLLTRHVPVRTGPEPWLFTYETADGTAVVPSTTSPTDAITTATPAGTTTLRTIAKVTVRLVVQADPTSRARPMIVTNEVGIPNLGIDRVGAGA